jgi:hypothetical protein
MGFFGKATHVPETGWEDFSNDEPAQDYGYTDEWAEILQEVMAAGGTFTKAGKGVKISCGKSHEVFAPHDVKRAREFLEEIVA